MGIRGKVQMKIKIKLIDGGKMPQMKTKGAACYDCYARVSETIKAHETKIIPLGFKTEVPEGYYMEIRGRSGLSSKGILCHTGTVDSDYRGEVGAIITNTGKKPVTFNAYDRISQMMIKEVIETELIEVDELSETERGAGGFGSTGV